MEPIQPDQISEDMLPMPGECLDLEPKPQMQETIEIFQRFQEETPSTFNITGTLTGAFLRSKRFEIETTEEIYTGKIADEAFEAVSKATLSREYTATIQEIIQRNEATDEVTKTKYELLSLR